MSCPGERLGEGAGGLGCGEEGEPPDGEVVGDGVVEGEGKAEGGRGGDAAGLESQNLNLRLGGSEKPAAAAAAAAGEAVVVLTAQRW